MFHRFLFYTSYKFSLVAINKRWVTIFLKLKSSTAVTMMGVPLDTHIYLQPFLYFPTM